MIKRFQVVYFDLQSCIMGSEDYFLTNPGPSELQDMFDEIKFKLMSDKVLFVQITKMGREDDESS